MTYSLPIPNKLFPANGELAADSLALRNRLFPTADDQLAADSLSILKKLFPANVELAGDVSK